jgi:hypothetical protein
MINLARHDALIDASFGAAARPCVAGARAGASPQPSSRVTPQQLGDQITGQRREARRKQETVGASMFR